MEVKYKKTLILATILIALAIILGALGAHALEKVLDPAKLASFEVAVKYQIYHGIALLALVSLADKLHFELKLVFRFLITGVCVFSGSIYMLVFQQFLGVKLGMVFGPFTPIGGLLMIAGWSVLLVKIVRLKTKSND